MKSFYESINNWENKERYERWSIYRSQVTDYIIRSIKNKSKHIPERASNNRRILIIGAGSCEDIGLNYLLDLGYTITLSDIDDKSLERGKSQVDAQVKLQADPQMKDKVDLIMESDQVDSMKSAQLKVQALDYLGLEGSQALKNFDTLCRQGGSFGDFADTTEEIIEIASNNKWQVLMSEVSNPKCQPNKIQYDFVICLPIYTQLLYYYMSHQLGLSLDDGLIDVETVSGVEQLLMEGMPKVIDQFNNNLVEALKPKGCIIVLSDRIEDKEDGPYTEAFGDGLSVDGIVEAYVSEYGMGLGDYGIYSLDDKLSRDYHQWFLWPFSKGRTIIVEGVTYTT